MQQMLILPTWHFVFQEEVKLIGYALHNDFGNASSYGSDATLDAIFLRQVVMHSMWI